MKPGALLLVVTAISIAALGVVACDRGSPAEGDGGASSSSGTSTASEGGEGTGGSGDSCDPTTTTRGPDPSCGIFVSASLGSDVNPGTRDKPVYSIQFGVELAHGKPVYVCGESFSGNVTLPSGAVLFGSLDCKDGWRLDFSGRYTQLEGEWYAEDRPALTLGPGSGQTRVVGVEVFATGLSLDAGLSTIGVIVDETDALLEDVAIVAGPVGSARLLDDAPPVTTPATADGSTGAAGCATAADVDGGPNGENHCTDVETVGGRGGDGLAANTGGDGGPGDGADAADGEGGSGEGAEACGPGLPGSAGAEGEPGAPPDGIGKITASGFEAPRGRDGGRGHAGKGGGGGGGANVCSNGLAGASGGGGGAGGCGGRGGKAGISGGSSIGLLIYKANVTLENCDISAMDAGYGGEGNLPGAGGDGGTGGVAGGDGACSGGSGGMGGPGGPGGGGNGGHSLCIALDGPIPKVVGTIKLSFGLAGLGNDGGYGYDPTLVGSDGLACQLLDFQSGKCFK